MVDVKEKDQPALPAQQTAAPGTAPEKEKEKSVSQPKTVLPQKMSKGEKIFEWGTYRGLNYWVNLISSVIFTDWFKNLGGLKKLKIDKLSEAIAKKLPGSSPYEKKLKFALETFEYLALTAGGTALVWPLKALEDNKRKVVYWINEKLGVDQTAPDGHKLTPDEIYIEKEVPQKSWFNVIWRRSLGMASVAAGGHLVNYAFKTPGINGKDINGTDNVANFVLKGSDKKGGVNRLLSSGYVPGGEFLVKNKRAQAWMGLAVLDSVFTQLTAFIMWATNGAKKEKTPMEIDECKPVENAAQIAETSNPIEKDRSALKTKKPTKTDSFVDLAQQSNGSLAIAP